MVTRIRAFLPADSASCPPGAIPPVNVAHLAQILVVRKTFLLAGSHFLLVVGRLVPLVSIHDTWIFLHLIRIVGQTELDAPVDPEIDGLQNNVSGDKFILKHRLAGNIWYPHYTSTEWSR